MWVINENESNIRIERNFDDTWSNVGKQNPIVLEYKEKAC